MTCDCRPGHVCEDLAQMRRDIARHDRAINQLWAVLLVLVIVILALATW